MVKDFDSYSVKPSSTVLVSPELLYYFYSTGHPSLSKEHPSTSEWAFAPGESVNVYRDAINGQPTRPEDGLPACIEAVYPGSIEVKLVDGSKEILDCHEYCIWKRFAVGNSVKVVGGVYKGHTGFVDRVSNDNIWIIKKGEIRALDALPNMEVRMAN